MRHSDRNAARRRPGPLAVCVLALTAALVAGGPVTGSSGDPSAVAAKKKKCKKALWKCAPKRYHLSAIDDIGPGPDSPGLEEHWRAEVNLVRIARSIGKVDYGATGGTVNVSGSFATECEDGSPATIRIEPQTIVVPAGPGYPFLGDFGVEFSLIGSDKNTYGGPLGTEGSGNSTLYATAVDPCPEGPGAFQDELNTPLPGMEGPGKVGKALSGTGEYNTLHAGSHSYSWTLTPRR
jgi:hypothetical protein